jgi:hypothetical protein
MMVADQQTQELLHIHSVRLGPSGSTIHFDTRGVHHDIDHATVHQIPMQPEAIAPGLVTAHDGHAPGHSKAGFGLGYSLPQGDEIARSNGDDAPFGAIAQRQFPFFVTELQCHE